MKRIAALALLGVTCLLAAPSIAQARYADGMNLYEYVQSCPVVKRDAFGTKVSLARVPKLERDESYGGTVWLRPLVYRGKANTAMIVEFQDDSQFYSSFYARRESLVGSAVEHVSEAQYFDAEGKMKKEPGVEGENYGICYAWAIKRFEDQSGLPVCSYRSKMHVRHYEDARLPAGDPYFLGDNPDGSVATGLLVEYQGDYGVVLEGDFGVSQYVGEPRIQDSGRLSNFTIDVEVE